MPVEPDQARRLRELHETYVWKVNAAVGEGRDDLIRRLARDFTDEALRLITDDADNEPCRRPDCPVCTRQGPVGTGSARSAVCSAAVSDMVAGPGEVSRGGEPAVKRAGGGRDG